MKKLIIILFAVLVSITGFAQDADLVFVDGWVDIRAAGETFEAFSGDTLRAGDSVITGSDSYAELEQKDLSSIIVKPNSVFTIREIETASGRETVLSTTVGAVSFKFGKLFGREPMITTPSIVAGIRGTELTVYAGEDGSTLVAVESGLVSVESQGVTVDLSADEGVEVLPGEVPGEKFSLIGKNLDFSSWNKEKYENLLADPITGLSRMSQQIDNFIIEIQELNSIRSDLKDEWKQLEQRRVDISGKEGQEKASQFYSDQMVPIEIKIGPVYLNIRYHSLSALSFRRYILSRLYLEMKSKYIMDAKNTNYLDFLDRYRNITGRFEQEVVSFLDVNDI